jgi:uncharacterized paraquat-inducible protein A
MTMKRTKIYCMQCDIPMKKAFVKHKGLQLEARQCPKCKKKIFTEEQTMKVVAQLEAQGLEKRVKFRFLGFVI